MKLIHGLSSVALVSCLSANSGDAVARAIEQSSNPISPVQIESVLIAGFFDDLGEAVQTIRQGAQVVNSVNSFLEQENRRRELEAAREAASEQERLEAERRQQYFESLSPEERQAYIEEQRAREEAQGERAALLFRLMLPLMFGGSGSNQEDNGRYVTCSSGTDPNGGDQVYQVYVRAGESPPSSSCL